MGRRAAGTSCVPRAAAVPAPSPLSIYPPVALTGHSPDPVSGKEQGARQGPSCSTRGFLTVSTTLGICTFLHQASQSMKTQIHPVNKNKNRPSMDCDQHVATPELPVGML